jgi:tRNA-dihydrouridine synthase
VRPSAVTIHGRTREQGFRGSVNLDGIRAVVESVQRIPIIGNGDVRTIADAEKMLLTTGCAGVAIGRGALLNPWVFHQLQRWEQSGDPGPAATWQQRLDFMDRHFHLLVEDRGERFGCLTFRKVANWYCRVLRPGREAQQRLVRIESVRQFEQIVADIRERGTPAGWEQWLETESPIKTPGGPNERW